MGTQGMSPLPSGLIKRLKRADALVVEADISGHESPFAGLESDLPLAERLNDDQLAELRRVAAETGVSLSMIDNLPLWQIAMVLQATQAQRLGLRGDYGIDYQLLNVARARRMPIIELEGTDSQIALLRQLPDDGLMLLDDTLTHWHTNARLLQTMIGWWLDAPPADGKLALPSTFSESLYDVLMNARNKAARRCMLYLRGVRGRSRGAAFIRRREFAVAVEIKMANISIGPSKISSFYYTEVTFG